MRSFLIAFASFAATTLLIAGCAAGITGLA